MPETKTPSKLARDIAAAIDAKYATDPEVVAAIIDQKMGMGEIREVLRRIASVEVRPGDERAWPGKGLVACRNEAAALLSRLRD